MSALEIIGTAILAWLWMTRLAYRWDVELHENPSAIGCFFFWWLAVPVWLPEYLRKRRRGSDLPRWVVGESGWHKRERLEHEHKERAKEVEMPHV